MSGQTAQEEEFVTVEEKKALSQGLLPGTKGKSTPLSRAAERFLISKEALGEAKEEYTESQDDLIHQMNLAGLRELRLFGVKLIVCTTDPKTTVKVS